jgi:hypothetical protein
MLPPLAVQSMNQPFDIPKFIYTLETMPEVRNAIHSAFGPNVLITPRLLVHFLLLRQRQPPPPEHPGLVGATYAYINYGRWLIDCPLCGSAFYASKVRPHFWCPACRMTRNGGNAMRVLYPPQINEIERLLCARPEPKNRNWRPAESVAILAEENRLHGIGS